LTFFVAKLTLKYVCAYDAVNSLPAPDVVDLMLDVVHGQDISVERLCISLESFTHEHLVSLVMNILLVRGSAGIDDILGIMV